MLKKICLYVSATFGKLKSNTLAMNLNPFVQVLTISSSLFNYYLKQFFDQIKSLPCKWACPAFIFKHEQPTFTVTFKG